MLKLVRNLCLAGMFVVGAASANVAQAEEVYMIRGFLNVFSDGMNQMTRQLKARGIRVRAISNGDWANIANDIIRRSKSKQVSHPIVIAGHSLGGVEAARFANRLGQGGVKTALLIGLDPGFPQPPALTKGAQQVVNYKIPSGKNYRRGRGFDGQITTIDVSRYGTDHVGIDKNKRIQGLVVDRIRKKVGK
ncbi:MAG: hypothetical protein JJ891_11430 [Rhizobiaceae bacterium]|jgi:pimeloyl-ACP methyl ester carboxylesterase|nr:hypothetical protein [Rhizobiaceae bacterium]